MNFWLKTSEQTAFIIALLLIRATYHLLDLLTYRYLSLMLLLSPKWHLYYNALEYNPKTEAGKGGRMTA